MLLTEAQTAAAFASQDPDREQAAFLARTHPYYVFEPRADNAAAFDEQSAFVNSKSLVTFAVGGNGSGKTLCAAHKVARFVLEEQAPPNIDTPFWILTDSMDQVGQTAWVQKLSRIIPRWAYDYGRISWHNERRQFPRAVPLRPWRGRPGANWVLEFKSYEQGRSQMQAAAIGGAWFTEQFPWDIFEEVIRGCREAMYPGSIFAEFTPVDPVKSAPVEALYERWLSKDPGTGMYRFCRLSTDEALRLGHVDKEWYDAFFGTMVSEEMMETRKRGAFASYEGAIFQGFDPKLHVVDLPRRLRTNQIDIPKGVFFRRGLDWGSSAEHPFVCLWAYRDGAGRYVFFDEYWDVSQTKTALDHADCIKAKFPWPEASLFHKTAIGDPSRPDMMRLFRSQGIPVDPAINKVHEGIETVRNLLKDLPNGGPRILIDRKNCPHLIRTLRAYRWKKRSGKGVNPQSAPPEPLKLDDDPCFPAGQMVDTPTGPRAIETLVAGDEVLSHLGVAVVLESRPTGVASLVALDFADGRRVECTAGHPLASSDGRWVEAWQSAGLEIDTRLATSYAP